MNLVSCWVRNPNQMRKEYLSCVAQCDAWSRSVPLSKLTFIICQGTQSTLCSCWKVGTAMTAFSFTSSPLPFILFFLGALCSSGHYYLQLPFYCLISKVVALPSGLHMSNDSHSSLSFDFFLHFILTLVHFQQQLLEKSHSSSTRKCLPKKSQILPLYNIRQNSVCPRLSY